MERVGALVTTRARAQLCGLVLVTCLLGAAWGLNTISGLLLGGSRGKKLR